MISMEKMEGINIIGIFMDGPNPSACLLKDGKLIAMCEEERFVRVKKANGYLPIQSIKFCLKDGNVRLRDISYIAIAWEHEKYPKFIKEFNAKYFKDRTKIDYIVEQIHSGMFDPDYVKFKLQTSLKMAGITDELPKVKFIPHHLCHAASTYYLSGFNEATILTIDGSGEENATVIWQSKGAEITKIKEINLPNSLGWFYSAITEFLGFKSYSDEGKTMGLAPYGKENLEIRSKLTKILKICDGEYTVDGSYIYFDKRTYSSRFTDKVVDILGKPHVTGTEFNEYYKDIAYETQYLLEKAVESLVTFAIKKTCVKKLCIAGGIGMNCKMNGKISRMDLVEELFVIPASSDEGTSLGAALGVFKQLGGNPQKNILTHVYFGPHFSNEEIKKVLENSKLEYNYCENIEKIVAQKLAEDKIVGWFQGKMEFAARALGNRSILANPLNKNMKNILNAKVKHREVFRPFCPSLLSEDKDIYLKNAKEAPFMIVAYDVKDDKKDVIPGVVHVDNTVRPQTVRREDNERYWNLLHEFKKITNVSVILNTSFNVMGEPIVCTPEEAIRCFFGTGVDCLAIGNYLLEKKTKKQI